MNKFDPAELLSLIVTIARDGAPKRHISEEFACASSSVGAGSSEADPFYLTPAQQYARETGDLLSRAGRLPSVRRTAIEDTWWVTQDHDQRWIDEQTDNIDPKHWK